MTWIRRSSRDVDLVRRPVGVTVGSFGRVKRGVARTVDGLIAYLQGLRTLVTSDTPTPITIDGHAGKWLAVSLSPRHTSTCPGDSMPGTVFLASANGTANWELGAVDRERERLVFRDLGGADVVVISIASSDPARFEELVTEATPIIESMTFH